MGSTSHEACGPEALDELEGLLARLREQRELKEKRRGVFYHRSKAFLPFHEDPTGPFADARIGDAFSRFPVSTPEQRQELLALVRRRLLSGSPTGT
jgi:hypothetical protein